MSKSLPPLWLTQLLDNNGDLLSGGKIYTYAAGTTTPLVSFSDSSGAANTNPVILDSAGRASVFITPDTGYKFVLKDASDNILLTVDNIVSDSGAASLSTVYEVILTYAETPGAQGWMGGEVLKRSVTFPIDWEGSGGAVITNPGSDYIISIQKNGVEVGTATIDTSGVFTFATTGGATVSFVSGDSIDFYAPASVGTAASFKMTLVGSL
jgi:hypothetical protein